MEEPPAYFYAHPPAGLSTTFLSDLQTVNCLLSRFNWVDANRDYQINHAQIAEDFGTVNIADEVGDVDAECQIYLNLDHNALAELEGRQNGSRRRPKRKREKDEMVLSVLRRKAYFSCVHFAFETACARVASEKLLGLLEEEKEVEEISEEKRLSLLFGLKKK